MDALADSGEGYLTVEGELLPHFGLILTSSLPGNEGDRNNLAAWHSGDALVTQVASVNSKTIVVVNSVGPIVMEAWINNPNGRAYLT